MCRFSNRWWTQQGLEELEYPALDWRAGRAASRPHGGHSILLLLLLVLVLLFFSAPCSQWQQQSQRGRGPIRRTWGGNKSGGATDGEVEPPSSPSPPHHHHHHHYHHQHQHLVFISATSTQMTTTSSTFLLLPPISQNRAGLMGRTVPTTKEDNLSLEAPLWYDSLQLPVNGLYLFACFYLFVCGALGTSRQSEEWIDGTDLPPTPPTPSQAPPLPFWLSLKIKEQETKTRKQTKSDR